MATKVLNEGERTGVFIVSEANHTRSREEGTLAANQVVGDGAPLKLSAGKLVLVENDDIDSEGDIADFAGLCIGNFDTTEDGNGNEDWLHVPYLARDAEINIDEMALPEESTEGGEHDAFRAFFVTKGLIPRDSGRG